MTRLSAMEQHSKFLEDSLKAVRLNSTVSEQKMNNAMRHLSRSLSIFTLVIIERRFKKLSLH